MPKRGPYNPLLETMKKAEETGSSYEEQAKASRQAIAKKTSSANSYSSKSSGTNHQASSTSKNLKKSKTSQETPTAPYNFVKLNDVVVSAPFSEKLNPGEEQQAYKEFLTGKEAKYSGYFEIEVENIRPLFINNGNDEFFSDGVNYLIPGSSLRGAIKNYFKIITNGTMRTGDDGDVTDSDIEGYSKTVANHIPSDLNSDKVDFAAAVFGNKEMWSSRVFFENLYLQGKGNFENKDTVIPLMGPNLSTYQNYLEPENGKAERWNSSSNIRGYKMYWHRNCDWRRPANVKNTNEKVTKKVAPLKCGCSFTGRIRFENLSAVELGALTKVLSLGDDGELAYKLGMGKPIGIGSVKLKSTLYLQGDNYYTKLFGDNGFDAGLQKHDKKQYIDFFEGYMKKTLKADSFSEYSARKADLKAIMKEEYRNQRDWTKKTDYMKGKRKNKSTPLPSISEVVNSK